MYVTRKATGKVLGWDVSANGLDLYLAALPRGVYSVEDSNGNELKLATVKGGRVVYTRE